MNNTSNGSLTCKRWLCALVAAALLLSAVSALAENASGYTCNPNGGSYVNLRLSPSYSGIIADRIPVGTLLEIHGTCGAWRLVSVQGEKGYIHENFISALPPASAYTAVVSGGSLNLRAFAHTDAPILGIYPEGTLVSVLSKGEIWSQVSCQGQTGYMLSAYLSHHISAAPVLPSAPAAPSVPETPKANASVSTKNGGRLNLRQDASTLSAILTSFANGTRVQVLTHGSLWCKVRVGEWVGYMKTDFLAFDDAAVSNSTAAVNNPQNTQVLHLRQSPSVSSRSLAQYRNGKLVTVLGVGSQWCRVRVDGRTGYMMTRYLTLYYGAPSAEKTVVNPGTYVNLRSDSSYDGSILMQVAHGTKVTVLAPLGAWSRVRVGSMSGYMVSSFLR